MTFYREPETSDQYRPAVSGDYWNGNGWRVPSDDQSKLFDDDAEGTGNILNSICPAWAPFPEVNDPDYSTMGLVGQLRGGSD